MFEKTALIAAKVLYGLIVCCGIAFLAWLCFAHLPFWGAVFALPIALVLMALAGAPLAAGASLLGGVLIAVLVVIGRKATASSRSAA
ncbi:hypothetical protein [Chromobacterium haemolyticum]|uniref:hypothetical protein n=1 Tax=Chromobacterium haemolyticum TaxID=394935 RepID=UPI000D31C65E|nr:hypothetical protein [Chromobacterium haemolyticum]PTU70303.1 hypothetical protein DBB33_13025 [Chromobacterium haemolyticum]